MDCRSNAKQWRTWMAFLTWICMGAFSEISGPTLPFLRQRVNANYEEISRALMARSVGFLFGSFLGGILYDRWQHFSDLWLALACVFGGAGTLIAPFCTQLALLAVMFCADGMGKGIMAVGANHLLLILWDKKAAVPNQALHFSFGIGALLAPQLAMPFLPNDHGIIEDGNITLTNNLTNITEDVEPIKYIDDMVQWPYIIIGAFTLIVAALNIVVFFLCSNGELLPKTKPKKLKECCKWLQDCSQFKCTKENILSIIMMTLLLMYWALPVGAERAYGKFLFAFSTDSDLQFSNKMASILVLLFWAAFTLGRLIATGLACFMSTTGLMILELGVNTISCFLLFFLGHKNDIVLWTCSAFFAASLSPLFPGALAWANYHMSLTSFKTALAFISASVGAFIFSWLSGFLFEYHGPRSLMSFMLGYSILGVILFGVLIIIVRLNKNAVAKHKGKVVPEQEDNEEEL